MNRRSGRLLASLLVLGLVSACQTPIAAPERFALEAAASPSLVVRVKSPRRVQAVVEDVDHLLVTVKAADGSEPTRRIEASDFSSSEASVTFNGLASGATTVEVRALGTTHQVLGRANAQTTVAPGVLIEVEMALKLDPTYPDNLTMPVASGEMVIEAQLEDGPAFHGAPPPYNGPAGATFEGTISYLAADATGNLWLGGSTQWLVRYDAQYERVSFKHNSSAGLAADGTGHVWIADELVAEVRKVSPSGDLVATVPLPAEPARGSMATDAEHHLWVGHGEHVSRITPGGQPLGAFPLGGTAGAMAVHQESGHVWIVAGMDLVRVSPSGAVLTRVSDQLFPGDSWSGVAVDPAGTIWATQRYAGRVVKLGADGAFLGSYRVGRHALGVATDASGHAYVVDRAGVHKIDPAGTIEWVYDGWFSAYWSSEAACHGAIVTDASGRMWAASGCFEDLLEFVP